MNFKVISTYIQAKYSYSNYMNGFVIKRRILIRMSAETINWVNLILCYISSHVTAPLCATIVRLSDFYLFIYA